MGNSSLFNQNLSEIYRRKVEYKVWHHNDAEIFFWDYYVRFELEDRLITSWNWIENDLKSKQCSYEQWRSCFFSFRFFSFPRMNFFTIYFILFFIRLSQFQTKIFIFSWCLIFVSTYFCYHFIKLEIVRKNLNSVESMVSIVDLTG